MITEKLIFKVPYEIPDLVCGSDALAFIAAHEAATGVSMDLIQKSAICRLYSDLFGTTTTNGTNFLTTFKSTLGRIYPLVPSSDSVASAAGYALDMVSNGANSGSYVNFLSGDIAPTGVTGGTGKYFGMGITPSDLNFVSNVFGVYNRDQFSDAGSVIGSLRTLPSRFCQINPFEGTGVIFRNNDTVTYSAVATGAEFTDSLIYSERDGTTSNFIQNDTVIRTRTSTAVADTTPYEFYAHTNNVNGSIGGNQSTKELAAYFAVPNLMISTAAKEDWNEAWQRYQTNVITGGRNV